MTGVAPVATYVNTTWTTPTYDVAVAHTVEPVAISTLALTLVSAAATLAIETHRMLCRRLQRRSFLTALLCVILGLLLRLVDVAGPQPNDNVVVASWTADLLCAAVWLVAMLNETAAPFRSLAAGTAIGGAAAIMMLCFEPTVVVHRSLMVMLSTTAFVLSWSRTNGCAARCAAGAFVAAQLGNLLWDVPSQLVHHVPERTGLYIFNMFCTQAFLVGVLLAHRHPIESDPPDHNARERNMLLTAL